PATSRGLPGPALAQRADRPSVVRHRLVESSQMETAADRHGACKLREQGDNGFTMPGAAGSSGWRRRTVALVVAVTGSLAPSATGLAAGGGYAPPTPPPNVSYSWSNHLLNP